MEVKITCPKCNSKKVEIIAEKGNPLPMYKCANCGYKNNLFPQFGKKEDEETHPGVAELEEETRPSDAMLEEED